MRLSAQQVKQGIVHPERLVRDCALRYFSDSFSDDPAVMPMAIQAVETYGWDDAFEFHHPLEDLVQTEETLLWLIDRLNKMGRPRSHEQLEVCYRLGSMISRADVALLMKHEQRILGLEGLDTEVRDIIADRLRLMALDTDSCWQELQGLWEASKDAQDIAETITDPGNRLCEAIARDHSYAERVLTTLSRKIEDSENDPLAWMELFAARLAGEMRLEAAVPLLVGKLKDDGGDLLNEECQRSFIKVGTDEAVETICRDFAAAPWHYRLYASGALAGIRSDRVVARCLDLLKQKLSGEKFEANLIRGVLMSFATEGIEIGRQYTLTGDNEIRDDLLAAATLTGATFPELEKWKAEEARAFEVRKQQRDELWALPSLPQIRAVQQPEPPQVVRDLIDPLPVSPIARKDKVGRNDPCPCGSGKKYKKCCMNKGT